MNDDEVRALTFDMMIVCDRLDDRREEKEFFKNAHGSALKKFGHYW